MAAMGAHAQLTARSGSAAQRTHGHTRTRPLHTVTQPRAASQRRLAPLRCSSSASGSTEGGDDGEDEAMEPLGDWRAFRAKLIASQGSAVGSAPSEAPGGATEDVDAPDLRVVGTEAGGAAAEGGGAGWEARTSRANMQLLTLQDPKLAEEDFFCHPLAAPEAGCLLIAGETGEGIPPQMWQVVLLVLRHDEKGSLAVALNRPTRFNVGQLGLEGEGAEGEGLAGFASQALYYGGPLGQDNLHVVHPCSDAEGAKELLPGVYVGGTDWLLSREPGDVRPSRVRFFAGAMHWAPGELAREVASGAWYAAAASRPMVLKQCLQLPVPLWRECMELMGGKYAQISKQTYGVDVVEDD